MKGFHFTFVFFLLMFLISCKPADKEQFDNVRFYQPARDLMPFTLQHENYPFTEDNLAGKWTLLFLGYTFCPDICPTTMQSLARIYPELKQTVDTIQVVLVSADPQRDKLPQLNEYAHFFHPDFIALTAEHKELLPLTRQLGLVYSMMEGDSAEHYLVNHSASIVLINPKKQLVASFKPDFNRQPVGVNFEQINQVINHLLVTF